MNCIGLLPTLDLIQSIEDRDDADATRFELRRLRSRRLSHYQAALGGELEIARFGGSPMAEFVPPDWGDKIVYGRLRSPFGDIDAMDAPPGRESEVGGNMAIAIDVDEVDRALPIFAKLAENGAILMPFEETFFARRFGMTTDKFGVRWMVSVAPIALTAA